VRVYLVEQFLQGGAADLVARQPPVRVAVVRVEVQPGASFRSGALLGQQALGHGPQFLAVEKAVLVQVRLRKVLGEETLGLGLADLAVPVRVKLGQELVDERLDLLGSWPLALLREENLQALQQLCYLTTVELAVTIGVVAREDLEQEWRQLVLGQYAVLVLVEALDELVRS